MFLNAGKEDFLGGFGGFFPILKNPQCNVENRSFPFQHQAVECQGIAALAGRHPGSFLHLIGQGRTGPLLGPQSAHLLIDLPRLPLHLFVFHLLSFDMRSTKKVELFLRASTVS